MSILYGPNLTFSFAAMVASSFLQQKPNLCCTTHSTAPTWHAGSFRSVSDSSRSNYMRVYCHQFFSSWVTAKLSELEYILFSSYIIRIFYSVGVTKLNTSAWVRGNVRTIHLPLYFLSSLLIYRLLVSVNMLVPRFCQYFMEWYACQTAAYLRFFWF